MNRALFVVAMAGLTVVACADGSFPYQCSKESDCQAGSSCKQRLCILQGDAGVAEAGPDAGIGDAGSADAGDADAAALDAGASDGSLPLPDSGIDGGASDGGPNGCLISQAAYKSGDLDPANPCGSCQSTVSATSWTAVPNGTTCGNGLVCASGSCAANCWIESALYPSGATKYGNPCQVCQPNSSTTSWSNVAEGMSCGTGKYCHTGSCLEGCWIGSAFYGSGAARPGYPCQTCQPAASATTWSNVVDGTACPGPQFCACGSGLAWTHINSGTISSLYSLWGSGPGDIWAVGQSGTALRWRATSNSWVSYPTGTTATLWGVWGSGTNDVWAVGDSGTAIRWNGSSWSTVSSGTTNRLRAVTGTSANDVWAVGEKGTILRWTGSGGWQSTLTGYPSNDLNSVWSGSAIDAWAVGAAGGLAFHWDGHTWTTSAPTSMALRSVWGSSSQDVWAGSVTDVWGAWHWNGTSWSGYSVPRPTSTEGGILSLNNLWGSAANDIWAACGTLRGAMLHWNGTAWSMVYVSTFDSTTFSLNGIWGFDQDLWLVGAEGHIVHAKR